MGQTDATTHGVGGRAQCRDVIASWFAQKTYHYEKSSCGMSWQGGAYPQPHSWAVQEHSLRTWTQGHLGWGSALLPQHDRRWQKGESPRRMDGSTHLPAAPGTAHAYKRLGTTASPVAFNWECSCQAERIRAGERNGPSASLKNRAAVHTSVSF